MGMSVSVAQAQLFFLALTRILAILIHVPVLGGRSVPDLVKIGFGLALAMVMLPWQPLPAEAPILPALGFGFAMGRELLAGTLAGYACVLTFGALQIAGNLMGLGSGFTAGQILNPTLEDNGTPMDHLFLMTAFLIFLVVNGHHFFLLGLQRTFTALPLNTTLPELTSGYLLNLTAGLILAGIQMALPVMGTLLLTDLTLGLLARVAPQVHVFFLGVPLKVGVGLLALSFSIVLLAPNLIALFELMGSRMVELLGV
jgi:flagellar biosynthetic protein FliR